MKSAPTLFDALQRLPSESEGRGGARIWDEVAVDHGATLYFAVSRVDG